MRATPWLAGAAAVLAATGLVGPARAAPSVPPRVDLVATFGSPAPGTAATVHISVTIRNGTSSTAKPPAIVRAVLELPSGSVINTREMPECTASDLQLDVEGSSACPRSSLVGRGTVTADSGIGSPIDPLVGEDDVFNGPGQLIEVVTVPSTPASPGHDRLTIAGDTVTAHPPVLPGGPPDGHTDITKIDFVVSALGPPDSPYVRTPPSCPSDGLWFTTGRFFFADGSTTMAEAASPCHHG